MRKYILLISYIACILLVGCSGETIERANNLEDAYFQIIEKKFNNEDITKSYLRKLLNGFKYEKAEVFKIEGKNINGNDYTQQPYIFKYKNETLTLTYSNLDNVSTVEPLYTISDDEHNTSLSYIQSGQGSNSTYNFMFATSNYDIYLHKKISDEYSLNKGPLEKVYHEVSESIASNSGMDINRIKKLTQLEPTVDVYKDNIGTVKDYDIEEYTFDSEDEMMIVQYIKDEDKMYGAFYNNRLLSITKNTINRPLIINNGDFHTSFILYPKNIESQRQLLESVKVNLVEKSLEK